MKDEVLLNTEVGAVPASYSIGVEVVAAKEGLRLQFTQYGQNHVGKTQVIPMATGGLIPWPLIMAQIAQRKPNPYPPAPGRPVMNARDLLAEEEVRE